MVQEYEVIVIGAGPGGLSAGIFVARQRTSCLIISKDSRRPAKFDSKIRELSRNNNV